MKIKLTKIGNSQGIIIPKTIIDQLAIENRINLEIEDGRLIITPVSDNPREGWEQAIESVGGIEDDELLMGDYLEHRWDEEEWTW